MSTIGHVLFFSKLYLVAMKYLYHASLYFRMSEKSTELDHYGT